MSATPQAVPDSDAPTSTMPLRLAIDAKIVDRDPTGVGRYGVGLIQALHRQLEENDRLLLLTGPQTYIRSLPAETTRISHRAAAFRSSVLRSLFSVPSALRASGANVVHSLDHVGLPRRTRARQIVTVHDLLPLTHPEWFPTRHRRVVRWMMPRAVARADRVIVPSRFVADQLERQLHVQRDKIVVIPEAPDIRHQPSLRQTELPVAVPERFCLFVGRLEPRKNVGRLLRAMALLKNSVELPTLVLSGLHGPSERALRQQVGSLGLDGLVQFYGYASDETLAELYRRAIFVAVPSLAEGFGLPTVEAMASGTPLICSHATCLPEVVGDGGLFFDPLDPEQIADCIKRVLTDEDLRNALVERGLKRAAAFSWEDTAAATLRVYRDALGRA